MDQAMKVGAPVIGINDSGEHGFRKALTALQDMQKFLNAIFLPQALFRKYLPSSALVQVVQYIRLRSLTLL